LRLGASPMDNAKKA